MIHAPTSAKACLFAFSLRSSSANPCVIMADDPSLLTHREHTCSDQHELLQAGESVRHELSTVNGPPDELTSEGDAPQKHLGNGNEHEDKPTMRLSPGLGNERSGADELHEAYNKLKTEVAKWKEAYKFVAERVRQQFNPHWHLVHS